MTEFNLGYKITAKDDTPSALSSALSGVTKFAKIASKPITIPLKIGRAGLGLLREFNLGLRPLLTGLDNIIDRGGRLTLVSKSFQSLTGKNAEQAGRLAKELVRAASGTISLIKAQETAMRALSGNRLSRMTILESNCMQSTASAAGFTTGITLGTAFAALLLITGQHTPWQILVPWTLLVAGFGVFLAVPLKRQLINVEQLPFPSGIAATQTLRTLYGRGREATRTAYALISAMFVGGLLALLREGPGLFDWLKKLPVHIPQLLPFGGTFWGVQGARLIRWGFEPSVLLIGAGMIVGLRVSLSMLFASLLLYLWIGPALINYDAAHLGSAGYIPSIPLVADGQVYHLMRWSLWAGTALIVTSSLTSLLLQWKTVARSFGVLSFRKETITDVTDPQDPKTIASYLYIGRNRVLQRDYGNNTRMTYAYDGTFVRPDDFGVRQVIGTTHTFDPGGPGEAILDDRTYTWDRMFNKTQRSDVRIADAHRTHIYAYDDAYRLTFSMGIVVDPAVPEVPTALLRITNYNFDGVHNRLDTSGLINGNPDPATGSYTMNDEACKDRAMNKYTTTPLDQRNYDPNGNLTRILGNDVSGNALAISCLYDYRNRMVEYYDSVTGLRHTYVYDALGRRIVKTVDADGASPDTTRYFYGGETHWQVCEEQIALSQSPWVATTATYVYGRYIDEVLQMQRCEATPPCTAGTPPVDYYYHTDDLYNVMAVTDGSGNVVERYDYGDYGTPTFMDAAGNALTLSGGTPLTSSPIANPYLFTGRRYDPESGWYNYRTRYLDPKSGKFTTRDVIGIWGDEAEVGNGYTYVANGPGTWSDPFGLLSDVRGCSEDNKKQDDEYKPDKCRAAAQLALKNCLRSYKKGGPGAPTKENCFKTFTQHQAACRAGKPGQHNEEVMAGSDYLDCVVTTPTPNN